MRKGHVEDFFDLSIATLLIVIVFIFSGLFFVQPIATTVAATTFTQQFDDYFFTLLQTPLPHSSQVEGYNQYCYAPFDATHYTMGDLLSRAAAAPEAEREKYFHAFGCFFQTTLDSLHATHTFNDILLRVTLPDNSKELVGTPVAWSDRPALINYTLPSFDGKQITVAVIAEVKT